MRIRLIALGLWSGLATAVATWAGEPIQPPVSAPEEASIQPATPNGPQPLQARIESKSVKRIPYAGVVAARVGSEVITLRELDSAVQDWIRKNVPRGQEVSAADQNKIAAMVLKSLIERTLILQASRRFVKDDKQWASLREAADKQWRDEEQKGWFQKTGATNLHELREKLEGQGLSLERVQETYRREILAREFLRMKLGPRVQVALPEMMAYYLAHQDDFQRTAEVRWREVLIASAKAGGPDAARRQAQALLDRLRRGEDMAKVARQASHGATAKDGGAWTTTPDGYAVPAVNQQLATQPIGGLSPVIEGPDGFHIVKVEARREAGIAPFAEVQDQVRAKLGEERVRVEAGKYLDNLHREAIVTTIFDGTDSAPKQPTPPPQR